MRYRIIFSSLDNVIDRVYYSNSLKDCQEVINKFYHLDFEYISLYNLTKKKAILFYSKLSNKSCGGDLFSYYIHRTKTNKLYIKKI